MLTRSVVLASVTIVAALASCGGKATATGAGGTVAVTEGDTFLDQPEYRVTNGAVRIDVTNVGKLHHDLRVRNQQYFVETNPGSKSTGTVTLPKGTYDLFCSIPGHEAAKAKLVVE
jgi:plastocyanin